MGSPGNLEAKTRMAIHAHVHANKEVENSKVPHKATPTHQSHSFERRRTTQRWIQTSRYGNRFNGYCYSCNGFGHISMDFTFQGRKNIGSQSDQIRCWACDKVGHVAARCHTLRCFTCGGVGHKAQVCASRRRQSMRSFSYLSARKVYESWKKNDTGSFEGQRRKYLS